MIAKSNRPTRLRVSVAMRNLVRENYLNMDGVMYPLFLVEGVQVRKEISSMKGQFVLSLDMLDAEIRDLLSLGIRSVLLFGEPDVKDEAGSGAYDEFGIVQKGIRQIKEGFPEMLVAADACLCQYKSDGHCCFFGEDGRIKREQTLRVLDRVALSQARAGADIVAPSDMMDGRVRNIRIALDENGFEHVSILAYSAKYASNMYGPFRDAVHSAPTFGDRKSYQMDYANSREAMKEMELDLLEGADILMVKPAGFYQDILRTARDRFDVPMAAYQVSGEYAMLRNAVDAGLLNKMAIVESLMALKRSGADILITYFAKDLKELLREYYGEN